MHLMLLNIRVYHMMTEEERRQHEEFKATKQLKRECNDYFYEAMEWWSKVLEWSDDLWGKMAGKC